VSGDPTVRRAGIRRWLPLAAIVALIVAAFASGAHEYVTLPALREHREWPEAPVAASPGLASATVNVPYAAAPAGPPPTGPGRTLLTPIFPFFVVNLAPAFLGVRLPLYAWTTFVGIFPGTLVYTFIGAGLGKALAGTAEPSLENLVSTEILLGLGGLGAMSLLAVVVRRVMRRRSGGA